MTFTKIEAKGECGQAIAIVNPHDRDWTRHRYLLAFGAYGWTRLLVWANSLEDALDEAIDWLADFAPGHIVDDQVKEEFDRLMAERGTCAECGGADAEGCLACERFRELAWGEAEVDTTIGGSFGHYILAFEWTILAEDPSREEILELLGRKAAS